MEILKYCIKDMIRNDMDYIPEKYSDDIVYTINSDKSKTKEEFLNKFMTENKDLLELYVLNESTKYQKKTFRLIQTTLIIIAICVLTSSIISLILLF